MPPYIEDSPTDCDDVTCDECETTQPPEEFEDTIYGPRCRDCRRTMIECGACERFVEKTDTESGGLCPECAKNDQVGE